MIIIVEGPRGSGKSHLVDNFFAQNEDDRFIYYKWNFSEWVKLLEIKETGSETHYLSLANILTVLEIGNTLFKDKILVLDRSIFSAYVWANYRNRVPIDKLNNELLQIMSNHVYKNCVLIYVNRDHDSATFNRGYKDIFDKYENYNLEKQIFDEYFMICNEYINNPSLNNSKYLINNQFNNISQLNFNNLLNSFVDK